MLMKKHAAHHNRHYYRGAGIVNSIINKLPFELHLPGYRYCGPGTKLQKRLARGDPGINKLDQSCQLHDIAYSKSSDLQHRHKADYELEQRAWERVKSKDASLGEKAAAWAVTNAMKAKRKLGMGVDIRKKRRRRCGCRSSDAMKMKRKIGMGKKRKQTVHFQRSIVNKVKKLLKNTEGHSLKQNANTALKAARMSIKQIKGGRKNIKIPRVIPLPKSGGFLPLLPLFAGLGALGSLAGGASAIAKTVIDAKNAKKKLEEDQRHNRNMEAISVGKQGSGMYLKPYKKGYGLYLKKQKNL